MVSDLFAAVGPKHLTSVNWDCPHHQRSIVASLVQGAYVLERDRQQNRQGSEARAPPWWEFFHFELDGKLVDDADFSVFGAIYRFKPPPIPDQSPFASAPRYVIAYRGTLFKTGSFLRDLELDSRWTIHSLQQTSRFGIGMQAVRGLVSRVGNQKVWLAGHSLGSAMALLAGKNMVKAGHHIRTFLFNPPFVAAPIEQIGCKKVKQGIRITGGLIAAGLVAVVKGQREKSEDYFAVLSSWVPNLFVNRADPICAEYVGYFEQRRKSGATSIERLAMQNSIRDVIMNAFGKESEPLHLLPSARLTVNSSPTPDIKTAHGIKTAVHGIKMVVHVIKTTVETALHVFKRFKTAHGISQWWKPDSQLQSSEYLYK